MSIKSLQGRRAYFPDKREIWHGGDGLLPRVPNFMFIGK